MKKLMVVAFAMAIGLAANAAKVQWGLADGETLNNGTKDITAGTMYLVWTGGEEVDFAEALKGMTSYTGEGVIAAIGGEQVGDTGTAEFTGGGSIGETIIKANSPINGIGTGVKDFYVLVIDENAKDLAYAIISPNINNGETSQPKMSLADDFGYQSVAAIPEPTSGLLLLLGVAGLALRRRRA